MARKPDSFRIDNKKKAIIIYTNEEQTDAEKTLIQSYIMSGFTPKMEEKKKSKTVDEMREELSVDENALKEFEAIYKSKAKGKGFFGACKYYGEWAKKNKKD